MNRMPVSSRIRSHEGHNQQQKLLTIVQTHSVGELLNILLGKVHKAVTGYIDARIYLTKDNSYSTCIYLLDWWCCRNGNSRRASRWWYLLSREINSGRHMIRCFGRFCWPLYSKRWTSLASDNLKGKGVQKWVVSVLSADFFDKLLLTLELNLDTVLECPSRHKPIKFLDYKL